MARISLNKIQNVVPEFVNTRLMPAAPTLVQWVLGGSTVLILQNVDKFMSKYVPMLKEIGLVNEYNQLDIDKAKEFINGGFNATNMISVYGFNLTRDDGDALIGILDRYKD
jgi:hypothetical protein